MIPHSFRRLFTAAICLLIASCAVDSTPKVEGELGRDFKTIIPGTWTQTVRSNGISAQMIKVYSPDGTAGGVLLLKKTAPGVSLVMPEVQFKSRWRVVGDVVETYDVKASIPGMFKSGQVIRDRLLSVSPGVIVSRSVSTGEVVTLERVRSRG